MNKFKQFWKAINLKKTGPVITGTPCRHCGDDMYEEEDGTYYCLGCHAGYALNEI